MLKIGIGFDAHRFAEGRKLVLGGVEIDYHLGLLGHSDADVLLHAVCDALLGALALGDIGRHFPESDNRYKNIDSMELVKMVREMAMGKGYRLNNVDAIIIAQEPGVSPYIEAMRGRIAEGLGCEKESVSVKATTTEHMGFCGRKEGICALAVATVDEMEA